MFHGEKMFCYIDIHRTIEKALVLHLNVYSLLVKQLLLHS